MSSRSVYPPSAFPADPVAATAHPDAAASPPPPCPVHDDELGQQLFAFPHTGVSLTTETVIGQLWAQACAAADFQTELWVCSCAATTHIHIDAERAQLFPLACVIAAAALPHLSTPLPPTSPATSCRPDHHRGWRPHDPFAQARHRLFAGTKTVGVQTAARLRGGDDQLDPYRLTWAIVVGLAQAGVSGTGAWTALQEAANVGGAWWRQQVAKRGVTWARGAFAQQWVKAQIFCLTHPPRNNGRDVVRGAITALLSRTDWRGVLGRHRRKVLVALGQIAWDCGSTAFSASERQIAERAGLGRVAVRRHLSWLLAAGSIRRILVGAGRRATCWRIQEPPQSAAPQPIETQEGTLRVNLDLWRWRVLGAIGWLAYACLREGAATVERVAQYAGCARQSARRTLRRLQVFGIAQEHNGVWSEICSPNELVGASLRNLVPDVLRLQQVRHRVERAAWHRRLGAPARRS